MRKPWRVRVRHNRKSRQNIYIAGRDSANQHTNQQPAQKINRSMQIQAGAGTGPSGKKMIGILTALAGALVLFSIGQDFLQTLFRQSSAFYFSESFMFSSFWWLFVPLLYAQYQLAQRKRAVNPAFGLLLFILPFLLHLFVFPALVWGISHLFYYHTFRYGQTLQYGLSQYLYHLLLLYSLPLYLYLGFRRKRQLPSRQEKAPVRVAEPTAAACLTVSEGNRKMDIVLAEVRCFTASPPYIHIHHKGRKYLYRATLKRLSEKLDGELFVRIHKSTIVNIKEVQSYTSRLNGDYDLTLTDGSGLRVSRNYAREFKTRFHQAHRLGAK